MAPPGRNEPCSCGSGKKFKHCCESKGRALPPALRLLIVALALAVAVAILVSVFDDHGSATGGAGRVWSPEHGHYHDR